MSILRECFKTNGKIKLKPILFGHIEWMLPMSFEEWMLPVYTPSSAFSRWLSGYLVWYVTCLPAYIFQWACLHVRRIAKYALQLVWYSNWVILMYFFVWFFFFMLSIVLMILCLFFLFFWFDSIGAINRVKNNKRLSI